MLLNAVEKALMNNPVRAAIQRRFEARELLRMGGRADGMRVLEIGCGRGVGTEIIVRQFGAAEVHAFDLDPEMVRLAQQRVRHLAVPVNVFVGDATRVPFPDASFDAVFDFGIIHHVPVWREAVREVARVLRPGGKFYVEEVTRKGIEHWSFRLLEHPRADRFSGEEFVREIEASGIAVGGNHRHRFAEMFVMGVGQRQ